ncbi:MAG TPA: alpha-amylase family glycosyl hydrolase, partial [Marinagarivorans sp.]
MYEQRSHSVLNHILENLDPSITQYDLRYFLIRLGANFYAIHTLFEKLYRGRHDFDEQLKHLVERMAQSYISRPNNLRIDDRACEDDYNWFLSEELVGMALYTNGFAADISDLHEKLDYFEELGINVVHLMPILKCPQGASDGGYAVSNYREIDPRIGDLADLQSLVKEMRQRDMHLVLDVVVNHTSDEHEWAQKAQAGDKKYQDYFYMFDDRHIPDMFEQSLPEIFPETAPGNFTWNEASQKWVMTVFNDYQWDLNYSNPAVFIEMLDIILFWANQGADIVRLDAVAFLWKKIGTMSQNEREAH